VTQGLFASGEFLTARSLRGGAHISAFLLREMREERHCNGHTAVARVGEATLRLHKRKYEEGHRRRDQRGDDSDRGVGGDPGAGGGKHDRRPDDVHPVGAGHRRADRPTLHRTRVDRQVGVYPRGDAEDI